MTQEEKWLLSEKYNGEKCEAFFTDLALLKSGTPLAYLIGSVPFLNCTIYLDSHPLIPRVETEFWTEKAIQSIQKTTSHPRGLTPRILDLCAGSGAIGVAVAKGVQEVQVDFAEIDLSHLPTIEKNINHNTAINRSIVIESDLFESVQKKNKYDFILTNPPYIDPEIDRAEKSVKLHEPNLALYGGAEGMECIEKIIEQASAYLVPSGQLWIEHEPEQSHSIKKLASERNFTCTTHKDQYDVERYSILMLQ